MRFVLEGLKREAALAATQVWLDGHEELPDLVAPVEACRKLEESYPQAQWFKYGSRNGVPKLFIDAIGHNIGRCRQMIFLEDDCFPAPGAITEFLSTLEEVARDPDLFSAYGHHFGTADEGERTTAFQGWGWASPTAKLRPVVEEFTRLWMMPEPEAVAWFRQNLTAEIRARMDLFPGRAESRLLERRFCFDAVLAFLIARQGMMNKRTEHHVVHNFGIGVGSGHFIEEKDWLLKPPYNMTTRQELIERFALQDLVDDAQGETHSAMGRQVEALQNICDERLTEIQALKAVCDERLALTNDLQQACRERETKIGLLTRLAEDMQAGKSALQATSDGLATVCEQRLAEIGALKAISEERLSLINDLQRACREREARIGLLTHVAEDMQAGMSALQATSDEFAAVCEERLAEIGRLKAVCEERLALIEGLNRTLAEAANSLSVKIADHAPAERLRPAGSAPPTGPGGILRCVKRLLRPNLNRFEQYRPRPLIPTALYRMTGDPAQAPAIAMVTPSLNQGRFIGQTIASVMQQGYPRLAYVVQDGGSTDGTAATLESHGDSLIWSSKPDRGQADAINLGFAQVQGEIMAWLNSDDLHLPGTLAYVTDYFASHPTVDMIYGDRIFIDAAGLEVGRSILPRHDPVALKFTDFVPQETLFWRRRVWDAVGPIDVSFDYALDWDFILRAQEAGFEIRHVQRFLGCFRVHDRQKTSVNKAVGYAEMQRIRMRCLGRAPDAREISRGLRGYMLRHVALDRAYRSKARICRALLR